MAISAVVVASTAVSYEANRKAESAQKRERRKQERALAAEKAEEQRRLAKEKRLEAAAKPFSGTGAEARIAAERGYLRRASTGRMGTIKRRRSTLG